MKLPFLHEINKKQKKKTWFLILYLCKYTEMLWFVIDKYWYEYVLCLCRVISNYGYVKIICTIYKNSVLKYNVKVVRD